MGTNFNSYCIEFVDRVAPESVESATTFPQTHLEHHRRNAMKEQFKTIQEFPTYQISNFGRVKRITIPPKPSTRSNVKNKGRKERILKPIYDTAGYPMVTLYHNGIRKNIGIHRLVWDYFGNEKKRKGFHIDHIDGDIKNSKITNLQLLTPRQNNIKSLIKKKKNGNYRSKYLGAQWYNRDQKWLATIYKDHTRKHIGYFDNELDAHLAYKKELEKINVEKERLNKVFNQNTN